MGKKKESKKAKAHKVKVKTEQTQRQAASDSRPERSTIELGDPVEKLGHAIAGRGLLGSFPGW